MSYEYTTSGQRFDLPNPYRVHNVFLGATAGVALLSGLLLLVGLRERIEHDLQGSGLIAIGIAVLLVSAGIAGLALVAKHLRFFFGRSYPTGLAGEVKAGAAGQGKGSSELREMLRQNALTYAEPQGAVAGLLYSWLPDLFFAPTPLRLTAERQFNNVLVIAVLLASFLFAWLLGSSGVESSWVGYLYGALSVWLLFRRIPAGAGAKASVGNAWLVLLIVSGILLPVLLRLFMHRLPLPSFLNNSINGQVAGMLACALVASWLFLLHTMRSLTPPPSISMACEQRTVNINAHPAQLTDEIERELQQRWTERVPNRRYVCLPPEIPPGSRSGRFEAEVLEETQPFPTEGLPAASLAEQFADRRSTWAVTLAAFGTLLGIASSLAALACARAVLAEGQNAWQMATLAFALASVSLYALRGAYFLFGRFAFRSTLIWIEARGSYQAARLDFGNAIQDRLKTAKDLINIENMTLRVWVAELDSTIFGKQGVRHVTAMRGEQNLARYLADHLTRFAHAQSMLVAPTSGEDLKRAALIAGMNQIGDAVAPPSLAAAAAALAVGAAPAATHCTGCGTHLEEGARFCMECGAPVGGSQP